MNSSSTFMVVRGGHLLCFGGGDQSSWSQQQPQRLRSLLFSYVPNYYYYYPMPPPFAFASASASASASEGRRHVLRLVPSAKDRKKRPWWHNFFSDDGDDIWSGWTADDVLLGDDAGAPDPGEGETSEFESWKRRAEAISELREAQEDARNAEGREWEDWLGTASSSPSPTSTSSSSSSSSSWDQLGEPSTDISDDPYELVRDNKSLFGSTWKSTTEEKEEEVEEEDDELLFEDRVFQYASTNSVCEIASTEKLLFFQFAHHCMLKIF